jgi:hypothetical protein
MVVRFSSTFFIIIYSSIAIVGIRKVEPNLEIEQLIGKGLDFRKAEMNSYQVSRLNGAPVFFISLLRPSFFIKRYVFVIS